MSIEEIKSELFNLCRMVFVDAKYDQEMFEYLDFVDDLAMESLEFVTLIVQIESCFDIQIPDELISMDNFRNMDDIANIIYNRLTD